MNKVDIFGTLIKTKKVRNGIYANQYSNGTINIDGRIFLFYSMTGAIKTFRKKYKK
jgi:hypothetical protein